MRVGLIGFGKTGRAVASVLLDSPLTQLEWVVRQSHLLEHRSAPEFLGVNSGDRGRIYSKEEFTAAELLDQFPVDVIVDFSSESGVDYYAQAAAERGVTVISAVSHYEPENLEKLKALQAKTVVMHSPNITLGINFLILSARMLRGIAPFADVEILEQHFREKPEVSGTARKIAQSLELEDDRITSLRLGGIVGVHEVIFGFPYQTVRITHESIRREAFGTGAAFALGELSKRPYGFYTFDDLLMRMIREQLTQPEAGPSS